MASKLPLLSMHFFAYATMLTALGIWGGPYLFDVHKLGGVQRGNVLLAMGLAQTLGILAYGPMDRMLGSRKKVVFGGALISAFFLGALALISQPPLWLAVALLIADCFFGAVIVVQGRTLFPDRLSGCAVATSWKPWAPPTSPTAPCSPLWPAGCCWACPLRALSGQRVPLN